MSNEYVRFIKGNKQQFDSVDKDENAIYFISDEQNSTNKIYVGETCFSGSSDSGGTTPTPAPSVEIIQNLSDATTNNVLSASSLKSIVVNTVKKCEVITSTDSVLPQILTLNSDTEYRYTNLSGASTLNVSITNSQSPDSYFYSSVILSTISVSGTISDFLTIDSSSDIDRIIFLNDDVELKDTAEILFFSNGLHVCCIVATYDTVNL